MSSISLPSAAELVETCKSDGEFLLATRHMFGSITFTIGDRSISININNGEPTLDSVTAPAGEELKTLSYAAPEEVWQPILKQRPERLMLDINFLMFAEAVQMVEGTLVNHSQYYSAVARLVEILREPGLQADPHIDEARPNGTYDAPVGRYMHVELDGVDYRLYYEEAGVGGIPMLLQHTAGCHGSQFRHLFENPEITKHFHLIAYDLPYHGKSLPPVSEEWWKREYKLTGEFVRSVPVALAKTLKLDRPLFMGCSVGGMLALDLAYHHPEVFSHCISLEGGLKVPHVPDELLSPLWHPQVTNEFKARLMNGIMAPMSPERYRKEVQQVYAAGWPNLFLGDLQYYGKDYDLRGKAQDIDTSQCAVTILSAEYDGSGTVEMGREAHETIKGSKFIEMDSMGHFPMTENPVKFMQFLQPVLDEIVANR